MWKRGRIHAHTIYTTNYNKDDLAKCTGSSINTSSSAKAVIGPERRHKPRQGCRNLRCPLMCHNMSEIRIQAQSGLSP